MFAIRSGSTLMLQKFETFEAATAWAVANAPPGAAYEIVDLSLMPRKRQPTINAQRAMRKWVAFCISIGWKMDDRWALRELWWQHHDDKGRLF